MNTLLIIGSDGWLGNAIQEEINKVFLDSLDIKQIIMHTRDKKVEESKYKNQIGSVELHNLNGDFLIQETFNELDNSLKKNNNTYCFTKDVFSPTKSFVLLLSLVAFSLLYSPFYDYYSR